MDRPKLMVSLAAHGRFYVSRVVCDKECESGKRRINRSLEFHLECQGDSSIISQSDSGSFKPTDKVFDKVYYRLSH